MSKQLHSLGVLLFHLQLQWDAIAEWVWVNVSGSGKIIKWLAKIQLAPSVHMVKYYVHLDHQTKMQYKSFSQFKYRTISKIYAGLQHAWLSVLVLLLHPQNCERETSP